MKKLLALLLALVMVMGLVACTPEDDKPAERVTISMPSAVTELKEWKNTDIYPLDTDTVLRVLFTEDGLGDIDASKLWEEVTGVELEHLTWNNETMMNSLAAGDIPDAIVMPWNLPKSTVYEFGAAGKFLDFSKHLDKMPNLCAMIKEYPEILDVCTYPDGGMYSLPQIASNVTGPNNVIYIRTDMMEELGWEKAPASTDELLQFVKDAQAKYGATNPEFIAFCLGSKNFMTWNSRNSVPGALFPAFGELVETGLTVNSEKEVVLGAATEQYRCYLEYMNELWNSGAFATEIYTMDSTTAAAIVKNGNCAISMGTYATSNAFSDGVIDVEVMAPLTSQYQGKKQWLQPAIVRYRGCVANAKCEDLDTLLAWLDSFYAVESNPLNEEGTVWGSSIFYGVLGKHFTKDDEAQTWTSGEKFANYYDYLNAVFDYVPTESLKIKGEGVAKNLLPYAVPSTDLVSRIALNADDQDNYADMWSDMEKYISQMHGKFVTGQEDLETGWDNYLNTLKRMGLPEVLEIWQNAYDA